MSYHVLKEAVLFEEEIKKSRFLTYLEPVKSKAEAMDFLGLCKAEHPAARHWCWAYIVGDPENTAEMGCSDDGEPHGTAGRPMLNMLQHHNAGDLIAVSVRYFGGTKLGTGGLVRAYGGGVKGALDAGELIEKVDYTFFKIAFNFNLESSVRHCFEQLDLAVETVEYTHRVTFHTRCRESDYAEKCAQLETFCQGQAVIEQKSKEAD